MVETIRSRNTWPRVTSTAPVKKVDRRKDRQEGKKFREHLAEKKSAADPNETAEPDPRPADDAAAPEAADNDAAAKPRKKIDIVI